MSEAIQAPPAVETDSTQPTIQELAAFAFNTPMQSATPPPVTEGIVTDAGGAAVVETKPEGEGAAPQPQTPDYNAYVKETFGFENAEAAKAALKELEDFRAKPQTQQEIQFANEQSKKIHQLLKEGKDAEVYKYLDAQQKLSNLETMDIDQQLRLFYKMQNHLYDDELIDLKLKREYGFDEDDYKDAEGNVTDHVGLRLAKADAALKKQNDLQKAKEYFEAYKQKIELPDISTTQNVDAEYEAYKASIASAQNTADNVMIPAIKALKETDVPFSFRVEDTNNSMNFDVSIVPEATDFEKARQDSLEGLDFFKKVAFENGKFMPQNLQRAILLYQNFDKYVQSAARQAVNAERKRVVDKETADGSTQRTYSDVQPTELDSLAQFAFQGLPKTG